MKRIVPGCKIDVVHLRNGRSVQYRIRGMSAYLEGETAEWIIVYNEEDDVLNQFRRADVVAIRGDYREDANDLPGAPYRD